VISIEKRLREIACGLVWLNCKAIDTYAKSARVVFEELSRLREEEVERHRRRLAELDEQIGRVRFEKTSQFGSTVIVDPTAPAVAKGFDLLTEARALVSAADLNEDGFYAVIDSARKKDKLEVGSKWA
jgi:hypothetical protein